MNSKSKSLVPNILKRKSPGFTLIELMVVVTIIAGAAALVVPRLANRSNQTKEFLRTITTLSQQLHQKAKLNGTIYRLVIDLKDGGGKDKPEQYIYVESSSSSTVIRNNDQPPEKDRDGKEIRRDDFKHDVLKKPLHLPKGLFFENVELSRLKDPILNGRAFIHYLPQGLVEEAAIHLASDRGQKWTISIHPLTGKAEILLDSTSLKDIKNQ